jgi:hypothetical protein
MPADRRARCNRAATTGRAHFHEHLGRRRHPDRRAVIGASDKRGEDVVERPCNASDFLATIYHHLGIDYGKVTLNDLNGRPVHIVENGRAIPELIA